MRVAITVGEAIIARNILTEEFVDSFFSTLEASEVTIIADEAIAQDIRTRVGAHAQVVTFARGKETARERAIMSLARSGLPTRTNLWTKMRAYTRGDIGLLSAYRKRVFTALFAHSSLFKRFVRFLIIRYTSDKEATECIRSLQPDVLVCLSLTNFNFDVPLARAARQQKVPLLGMVRSWDNLSSHGLLRVVPDRFFLQNVFLRDMATKYQGISVSRVPMSIVGLPHYDAYLRARDTLIPKVQFFASVGFSPEEKLVFYGAMGEFLFVEEMGAIEVMNAMARDGAFGPRARVLVRAHPKFKPPPEKLAQFTHVVFDGDTSYLDEKGKGLTSEERYMHALSYADAVVTAASTVAVDAIPFGRRAICVGFDGARKDMPYWLSVKRYYDCYTHFEAFMETGAAAYAPTPQDLAKEVLASFTPSYVDEAARKRAQALLLDPLDGNAGRRLGEELARGLNAYARP